MCHICLILFFLNDTATTEIYTLSLHDALPILVVAGALAAGAQGAQQSPPGGGAADSVLVRAVRFFRGDRTLVNGFVRVPHAMLDGIRLGPGGFAVFSVDVSIEDTAGTVLTQDRWARQGPRAAAPVAGAAPVDPLTFSVAPRSYH